MDQATIGYPPLRAEKSICHGLFDHDALRVAVSGSSRPCLRLLWLG